MSCNWVPTFELARNITYAMFEPLIEICPSTYIRPNPGGSLMLWLPTLLLLFFHLPTCVVRAVRWESAQYLALGLALLAIALSTQAYVSTGLNPDEILVWMPLTAVLDVGAMEQMIILIIEKHNEWNDDVPCRPGGLPRRRGGTVLWDAVKKSWCETREKITRNLRSGSLREQDAAGDNIELRERRDSLSVQDEWIQGRLPQIDRESLGLELMRDGINSPPLAYRPIERDVQRQSVDLEAQLERVDNPLLGQGPDPHNEGAAAMEADNEEDPHPNALRYAIVAFISFIFLLMLLDIQLYGLYRAVKGVRTKDLKVNWCSPAFRDFAVAVTTGNCQKYKVIDSSSNGIGCISLPGTQQRDWLRGTIIALAIALFSQISDAVLMICTNSSDRWRGIKFQRPWLTMIGGIVMLIVLIVFGKFNASDLPKGVTETVWIYRKEPSRAMGRVCKGTLNPPGLRGVMIGFMDGLFQSLGSIYHGN